MKKKILLDNSSRSKLVNMFFFFNTVELLSACLLKICLWYCYHSNHLLPSFSLLFFPFLLQENRMERDRPGIEVTIVTVHDYYQEQEQWNKRPEFFCLFVCFVVVVFLFVFFFFFFHQAIMIYFKIGYCRSNVGGKKFFSKLEGVLDFKRWT